MKNYLIPSIIIIFTLFIIMLSVCNISVLKSPSETTSSKELASGESTEYLICPPRPPQPIHFDTFDDVMAFLTSPNLEEYRDEADREAYKSMVKRFTANGYVIRPTESSDGITPTHYLFLLPRTTNEDCGIGYWFSYKGYDFQVILYHADADILTEHGDGQISIKKYLELRYNTNFEQSPDAIIEYNGSPARLGVMFQDDPYIKQFIDGEHYYHVRTTGSKELLFEFLSLIQFEYVEMK